MDRVRSTLIDLYTSPEHYRLEQVISSRSVSIIDPTGETSLLYRHSDRIEIITTESDTPNAHSTNIIIPISQELPPKYNTLALELLRRRLPMLTPYEICRMKCLKRGERLQPLLIDVVVQNLPLGERLSDVVNYATYKIADEIYAAIAYLEQAIRDNKLIFDSLQAEDLILGKDGRLYPFRYDTLRFDHPRDVDARIEECETLREYVALVSGYQMSRQSYPPKINPYRETLCDIYGGHISCRAPHEGLIAVEDADGWGFVDLGNRVVIETKYMQVSDFSMGRAVVQLFETERFGVIDRSGEYILQPIYGGIRLNDDGGITHWKCF